MKISTDSLHAQEKEHYYLLDALGDSRFDAKSDRLLAKLAQIEPRLELTTLAHHIDEVWLREAYPG